MTFLTSKSYKPLFFTLLMPPAVAPNPVIKSVTDTYSALADRIDAIVNLVGESEKAIELQQRYAELISKKTQELEVATQARRILELGKKFEAALTRKKQQEELSDEIKGLKELEQKTTQDNHQTIFKKAKKVLDKFLEDIVTLRKISEKIHGNLALQLAQDATDFEQALLYVSHALGKKITALDQLAQELHYRIVKPFLERIKKRAGNETPTEYSLN